MSRATKKQIEFATIISERLSVPLPDEYTFDNLQEFISSNIDTFNSIQHSYIGQRIRQELHILDFVRLAGFTPVRIGSKGLYTTKEHDSLRIDPDKNCYYFNSNGDADSIIGFVAKYLFNGDFHSALKYLITRLDQEKPDPQITVVSSDQINASDQNTSRTPFVLPNRSKDMRRVFAYLTKTRKIDSDIVQYFVDSGFLYQDEHGNCVFTSYKDGHPAFACLRGTNTYKRFIGDVAGCDYQYGLFIDNHSDSLILTESIIDALSIMSILKAQKIDFKKYSYLPLAGNMKIEALLYHIRNDHIKNVYLALDNDEGGWKAVDIICRQTQNENIWLHYMFPEKKDWNEEIQAVLSTGRSLSQIVLDL